MLDKHLMHMRMTSLSMDSYTGKITVTITITMAEAFGPAAEQISVVKVCCMQAPRAPADASSCAFGSHAQHAMSAVIAYWPGTGMALHKHKCPAGLNFVVLIFNKHSKSIRATCRA